MGEPRELILKLGQKITDRIGVKVTENDPESGDLPELSLTRWQRSHFQ